MADGKFSKEVAKLIFKGYSNIYKNYTGSDPWFQTISDAVDKCEFSNSPNMTDNLAKFYNCTDTYLRNNCMAIDTIDECDPVEEFWEKCKGIKPSCTEWPIKIMLPEFCCKYPEVLTTKVKTECQSKCKEKPSQRDQASCTHECIDKSLALKKDGKYDFDAVKALLIANSNKSASWDKSIDLAVQNCKTAVEGI